MLMERPLKSTGLIMTPSTGIVPWKSKVGGGGEKGNRETRK